MIHIYTGNGQGKTTASCGIALRQLAYHKKVLFVQFFKPGKLSGEIKSLKKFKNFKYKNIPIPTPLELQKLKKEIRKEKFSLVVLDEISLALKRKLITKENLLNFLDKKREWILTGRDSEKLLFDIGDYITEMKEVKHPYRKGILAKKGIEY